MEYQMEGIDAFCILLPYYCILKNNSQKERRSGLESGRTGKERCRSKRIQIYNNKQNLQFHWLISMELADFCRFLAKICRLHLEVILLRTSVNLSSIDYKTPFRMKINPRVKRNYLLCLFFLMGGRRLARGCESIL